MRLYAGALAFLTILAAATTARAGVMEEFKVEGWVVGAYSDKRTGNFSHCATSVPYRSGITLFFHLSRDYRWFMGIANPRWRLQAGETFNLAYHIDGGQRIPVQARVTSTAGMVSIPLADSQALFESFRRGQRLYILAAKDTYAFNLTNSSKALAAILGCVQRYAHSGTAANSMRPRSPAPGGGAPGSANARDSEYRTEATVLAANLLAASGIPGFRILTREQIPAEARRFDAVWTSEGGLLGTVAVIVPRSGSTVDDVVAAMTAADSKDCRGAFSSGRYPTEDTGVGRLVTFCSGSSSPEVQYTVAPRRAGGFYVLGVTGQGTNSGAVLDAGTKLYGVALRALAGR